MTTPTTRLAEIAEREAFEALVCSQALCWDAAKDEYVNKGVQRLYAAWSAKSAQLTAAQARSREDAEIMREALQAIVTDPDLFKRINGMLPTCVHCGRVSGTLHEPDCIITKLRARADGLEGRTDG